MAQRRKRRKQIGLPPGSPTYVGAHPHIPVSARLFDFSATQFTEQAVHSIADCRTLWNGDGVTWLDVDGLHDVTLVQQCADLCGLHPLVVEDILHTDQRPKLEDHGAYLYLVVKMLRYDVSTRTVDKEQLSLIVTANGVLTFQERAGDVLEPIRDRIRLAKGRVRQAGPDYLAYAIIDAVVDQYFVILDELANRLEQLEEQLAHEPTRSALADIHALRGELVTLRRATWPLRDVLQQLERNRPALFQDDTRPYLQDLLDHALRVIENIDVERDVLASLQELTLSNASFRLNEVMKILTIISTIFIPLTFIVGVYGMNFHDMPELSWHYGYPVVWVVMVSLAVAMFRYFRNKGWFA